MIVMIVLSMLELRTGSPSFLRSPSNSVFSNCQALHSARSTPPSVTPVPGQPDDIPSRLIEPVDTFPQRQQMYGQSVSATSRSSLARFCCVCHRCSLIGVSQGDQVRLIRFSDRQDTLSSPAARGK